MSPKEVDLLRLKNLSKLKNYKSIIKFRVPGADKDKDGEEEKKM
jgi:hypothetical protein